jgi:hypothetical protein
MVTVDDATNNVDAFTISTVSIEYIRITTRIHQYSQMYTKWDDNKLYHVTNM